MLLHVLQENTFEFAARTFKQTKGVAMGTPVAPTLANLFMGNTAGSTVPPERSHVFHQVHGGALHQIHRLLGRHNI